MHYTVLRVDIKGQTEKFTFENKNDADLFYKECKELVREGELKGVSFAEGVDSNARKRFN